MRSFIDFLDQKDIIAVAVSFLIGSATQTFFQGLIDELVMPLVPGSKKDGKFSRNFNLFISMMFVLVASFLIIITSERFIGFT